MDPWGWKILDPRAAAAQAINLEARKVIQSNTEMESNTEMDAWKKFLLKQADKSVHKAKWSEKLNCLLFVT